MAQKRRTHKKLPKRKNQKKQSFLNKHFTTVFAITLAFFIGVGVGIYLYLGTDQLAIETQKEQIQKEKEPKKELTYKEKTDALEIEYADSNIDLDDPMKQKKQEEPLFHYEEPDLAKVDEVIKEVEEKSKTVLEKIVPKVKEQITNILPEKKEIVTTDKPKLVIIIDDVTTKYQIRKIKEIGYPVNMAFLPPTKNHPNSAKVAQTVERYMIHLPLQASSSKYEEEGTLHTYDSIQTIDARIKSIKELYPDATFINNHTGSKFTADYKAMDKLLQVLKKYNYNFVDSRTTAHSVAREAAKKHKVKFFSRNIFLDNIKDKTYIQNQLKKAVAKAKKDGKAIAIGHPFNITFNTLRDSKELLEGLELVYIEQL